jgi:hypothetical protein
MLRNLRERMLGGEPPRRYQMREKLLDLAIAVCLYQMSAG